MGGEEERQRQREPNVLWSKRPLRVKQRWTLAEITSLSTLLSPGRQEFRSKIIQENQGSERIFYLTLADSTDCLGASFTCSH